MAPPGSSAIAQMALSGRPVWQVIGGESKGGILVRTDRDTSSPEMSERLATGALVQILDIIGSRAYYEKINGDGPSSGWVSTQVGNKSLLAKLEEKDSEDDSEPPAAASDSEASTLDTQGDRFDMPDEEEGLKTATERYLSRFGQDPESHPQEGAVSVPLHKGKKLRCKGSDEVRKELAWQLSFDSAEPEFKEFDEHEVLCRHCCLPVGDIAYNGEKGDGPYHGECMAQRLLKEMKDEEVQHQAKIQHERKKRREEYSIGWFADAIPRNSSHAGKLACQAVPEGMCCLVFQENPGGESFVQLAATHEPAAAVNLEYLSIALEVKRREGREPLFSLDLAGPAEKASMQMKRFEPDWLAGTSLGEAMFQADYHLKELSMGEYEQPVLGMKSCFDYSDLDDSQTTWNGREWFLIKDAAVHVSENQVLLPHVEIGVEAREQTITEDGLVDVPLTRKDHPLVKYAESFSNQFDLIAERKSVIFHLRETAKAAVMAKFLIDSQVGLEDMWFQLAGNELQACPMEVPQLWNDRHYSRIRVKDGVIEDGEQDIVPSKRGIYGGVEFGMDLFDVAYMGISASVSGAVPSARREAPPPPKAKALPAPAPDVVAVPKAKPKAKAAAKVAIAVPKGPRVPPGRTLLPAGNKELGVGTARMTHKAKVWSPQGVDLNLDSFNISLLKQVSLGGHEIVPLESCTSLGSDFWESLEHGSGSQKELLRAIFNPRLSDRRDEGDRFVPPDSSPEYVEKLRKLVREEQLLQQKRRADFCSDKFSTDLPGDLFPASWTSTFAMAREKTEVKSGEGRAKGSSLQRRFDYEAEAQVFEERLKCTSPAFDKSTEDGTRFRIYNFGSLEVRTVQELSHAEEVAAVFSVRAPQVNSRGRGRIVIDESEQIVKVTEYVERARADAQRAGSGNYVYFVVLHTEHGNMISTEMLEMLEGRVTWEENPSDLEDRISLAKVLRTADCQKTGNSMRDMKKHMEKEARRMGTSADEHKCKMYARATFIRAQAQKIKNTSAPRKAGAPIVLSAETMAQLPKALKVDTSNKKKAPAPDFLRAF